MWIHTDETRTSKDTPILYAEITLDIVHYEVQLYVDGDRPWLYSNIMMSLIYTIYRCVRVCMCVQWAPPNPAQFGTTGFNIEIEIVCSSWRNIMTYLPSEFHIDIQTCLKLVEHWHSIMNILFYVELSVFWHVLQRVKDSMTKTSSIGDCSVWLGGFFSKYFQAPQKSILDNPPLIC
jgi:hypothetical protein